ncbi:acyltransferase [Microbacteriaceae bacterium VKM Ac-2854]|nr:acyltransferase [Microbacteriaceae bacterium VKM Ac-2854]
MSPSRRGSATEVAAIPRLRSLDGLRGLAAAAVVLHHCLMLWTPFANFTLRGAPPGEFGTAAWLATSTPLSVLVAGPAFVIVFFVLSGIAVVLPALRQGFDWWAYYPRRVVRLLLPVGASVVLATVVAVTTAPLRADEPNGWLAALSPQPPSWTSFVRTLDVTSGEGRVNSPLWSIEWELWFSFALPLFAILATVARGRLAAMSAVGTIIVAWLGYQTDAPAMRYLAPFALGALIVGNLPSIRAFTQRRLGPLAWSLILVAACAGMAADGWVYGATLTQEGWYHCAEALIPLCSAVIVLGALLWAPLRALLETRFFQWLGRISFSLYLVHVPIVLASGRLIGSEHWLRAIAVALPVSILLAVLFERFVEAPAHRLSKQVGAAVSARMRDHDPTARSTSPRPRRSR